VRPKEEKGGRGMAKEGEKRTIEVKIPSLSLLS
jgi:hypothetical protein